MKLTPSAIKRMRATIIRNARKLLPVSNGPEFQSYSWLVYGRKKPRPGNYQQ